MTASDNRSAASASIVNRLRGAADYEFGNLTPEQRELYRAAAHDIEQLMIALDAVSQQRDLLMEELADA